MSISASQCRAARSLINWSQDELAKASKVGRATLANFESEKSTPYERTLRDIQSALESAGIKFIEDGQTSAAGGPGVRLFKSDNQFDTDVTQTVQYPEHLQPDAPTGAGG
jgi:transcriptional regulator with XRE-family HTH domain